MRTVLGLVFGLGVLAATGCAAAPVDSGRPANPVALYDWTGDVPAMQALTSGTLEIRSGCLVVAPDDTGAPTIVAFPRSLVDWDAATGVLTYGGVEYRVGDRVSWGGGGVEVSASVDMPDACVALAQPDVFLLQDASMERPTPAE